MQEKNGLDIRYQQEKATRMMSSSFWGLKKFKKCRPVLSSALVDFLYLTTITGAL